MSKNGKKGRVFGVYVKNPETVKKIQEDCKKAKRSPSNLLNIIIENHFEQKDVLSEVK